MSHPKVGMHHADVKKRVKRISKMKGNPEKKNRLISSLLGQAEKAEKGAGTDISQGLNYRSCSTNFINQPTMTINGGFGNGKTRYCPECDSKPSVTIYKQGQAYCERHGCKVEES